MPVIEETELQRLHRDIEINKNKAETFIRKYEELNEENEKLTNHRTILGILSVIFLTLLLLFGILYLVSPKFFMNKSRLEEEGVYFMGPNEYKQIQEIVNSVGIDGASKENNDGTEIAEDGESIGISETSESIDGNIIYAVQIGAFQEKGVQLYSDNLIQFTEVRKEDFYKYAVGAFETLQEAQDFRKEIIRLGFKDAFVASYKNGKRVRIEEAY